mgnify:CR=1 FL=1
MFTVKRDNYLKYISDCISFLSLKIRHLNAICLYDVNHIAEDIFCDLLNTIFKWNLVNENSQHTNADSIDLIDKNEKIVVQVSSQSDKRKVLKSLRGLGRKTQYNGFRFIFLSLVKDPRKWNRDTFKVSATIKFNPHEDVLGPSKLFKKIYELRMDDLEKLNQKCRSHFKPDRKGDAPTLNIEVFCEFVSIFSETIRFESIVLDYCNEYCNGAKEMLKSIHHYLTHQLNDEFFSVTCRTSHLRIGLLSKPDLLNGVRSLEALHDRIGAEVCDNRELLDVEAIRNLILEEFKMLRHVLTLFACELGVDQVDLFTEFVAVIRE